MRLAMTRQDTARKTWPPPEWRAVYNLYAEHAAWYSGDPAVLLAFYVQKAGFWAQDIEAGERRLMMHIPIANDLARMSSRLLFSEHPKITIPTESNKATSERLQEIIELGEVYSKLSEAAETCAAMGGVFLKVNWDSTLADYPLLSVAQVDNAIPEWQFGLLRKVTFWRTVKDENGALVTHVERHEPGKIFNEIWQSRSPGDLGTQIDLATLTALTDTAPPEAEIDTGLDGLACVYVPNTRPNSRFRGLNIGQSDFHNLEGMMDSLDQAWSSWMRDIHLGLGRIMADQSFFQTDLAGQWQFNLQKEAYLGLNTIAGPGALKDQIQCNQFAIRAQEHEMTILNLCRQIFGFAGYAPQTFGLDAHGTASSGFALRTMERKSIMTAGTKADFWGPAVAKILEIMLQIDKLHLSKKGNPERPVVQMQDSVVDDVMQTVQTVDQARRATAMSLELAVQKLNPDMTHEQVAAEVKKIQDEAGANTPNPMEIGRPKPGENVPAKPGQPGQPDGKTPVEPEEKTPAKPGQPPTPKPKETP